MAADKQAGQHAVDDFVVADDDTAELLAHGVVALGELFSPLFHGLSDAHVCFLSGVVDGGRRGALV